MNNHTRGFWKKNLQKTLHSFQFKATNILVEFFSSSLNGIFRIIFLMSKGKHREKSWRVFCIPRKPLTVICKEIAKKKIGRREDELNDGKKYIFHYNLSCFAASEKSLHSSHSHFYLMVVLVFFPVFLFIPFPFTIGSVLWIFRFEYSFFLLNKLFL